MFILIRQAAQRYDTIQQHIASSHCCKQYSRPSGKAGRRTSLSAVLMQRHQSRLDTLADVSCGDMGHSIHPIGHEEHLRHPPDDANSSTTDSQHGLDVPANRGRSWTCAECGMMFPKSKLLETHARSTKHQAYRCSRDPLCRKAFGMRTAASRHEAAHSALMKHACSKCSARFRRRDHCLEHEAICVAYLPLPITRPVSTQAGGSEPKAAAPVSLPGREQQDIIDADDIPARSHAKQHDMHIVAHNWDSPGHYSPGHSPSGLSRPHPADLQNYHASNRGPADTTSTDAHYGSQISPTPIYTAQDTQQLDGSQQYRIDPPTQEHISQEIHEPQQPADPYTCTHHGCARRFDDQPERQKHMREHHPLGSIKPSQRDYMLDLVTEKLVHARSRKSTQSFFCNLCPKRFTRAFTLREHYRAHTGARPFSCTFCGRRFGRQHDRIRHQRRHTEPNELRCHGILESGASWGCGRWFSRAEALRRHCRSELGQICTKPFFDEEAARRKETWIKELEQVQVAPGSNPVTPPPRAHTTFEIPAGLLQQYLASSCWH